MNLHFDHEDWARIRRDYSAWWAGELERPLVQIIGYEPDPHVSYEPLPKRVAGFPCEMSAEEIVARVTPHFEAARYYGDAFPRWWVDFGPGIMAGFLGARVEPDRETVWFHPAEHLPASELHLEYDPDNYWWRRVQDVTSVAVQTWGGSIQVGHTDLGGNLDILASFRTTQGLLTDLYDAPEQVERLVQEITRLWIRYYDELDRLIRPICPGTVPWAPIWSPGTSYMLQSDFSYMISPEMFQRFVLPDLLACCTHLEHPFYHLDGPGAIRHLDSLLSIERLKGVQWVPGDGNPPPEEWPEILERIVAAGKLCQLSVTAEGALEIVRLLGGKGFMFSIGERMSADEAAAYLRLLEREDRNRTRP